MHDVAGVGITVATILASTFFGSQSIGNLRSEAMGKLDAIQRGMRDLYAEQARHAIRIFNLEQQQRN